MHLEAYKNSLRQGIQSTERENESSTSACENYFIEFNTCLSNSFANFSPFKSAC